MKYVILISHNAQARETWASFTEAERAAGHRTHTDLLDSIAEAGELVIAEALADPSQGRRPQVSDRPLTAADGPFPELKEHLAGFYLVDTDSIEDALAYAARIPEAAYGLVEVRPVLGGGSEDM